MAASITKLAWMGAALAAASGCSLVPNAKPETPALPAEWQDAPTNPAPETLVNWWEGFGDPLLNRLTGEALVGPDVRLAALRLRQSRALSRQTFASFLPELSGQGALSYNRAVDGPDLIGSTEGFFNGASTSIPREKEQLTGTWGPQVSWEVPLFQRLDAAARGAKAQVRFSLADVRAAQVAVAADAADAYVTLRAAQQSAQALSESAAAGARLADLLEISAQAGLAAPVDAADARRQAETLKAQVADARIAARQSESQLAVLRGRAPGAEPQEVSAALAVLSPVPSLALAVAPLPPADLLRARPDIARAEANIKVRAAALGIARADMLPSLNLTGSLNISDNIIGSSFSENLSQAAGAGVISVPLFDWGKRAAISRQRDAQLDQAMVQYQQAVTNAVAEATNALSALARGDERLAAARAAEAAAEKTQRGQVAAFEAGILSLADRLRADQQLIEARRARIDAEASQARAAIALYRAFGGGPPPLSPRAVQLVANNKADAQPR